MSPCARSVTFTGAIKPRYLPVQKQRLEMTGNCKEIIRVLVQAGAVKGTNK